MIKVKKIFTKIFNAVRTKKKSDPQKEEILKIKKEINSYKAGEMIKTAVEKMKEHLILDNKKDFLIDTLAKIIKIKYGKYEDYSTNDTCSHIFIDTLDTEDSGIQFKYNGAIFDAVGEICTIIDCEKTVVIKDKEYYLFSDEFQKDARETLLGQYMDITGKTDLSDLGIE